MPGSNDYSMDPKLISKESSNSTYSASEGVVPGTATTTTSTFVATSKPSPFYQQKDFRTEKLASLKGLMPDRKANRMVNRYMRSKAGQQAEADFARAESQKYMDSVDAYIQEGNDRRAAMGKPIVSQATTAEPTLVSKSAGSVQTTQNTPINTAPQTKVGGIDWDQRARDYGFKDQADVARWQATQSGLAVDGKFGNKSIAKWQALQQGQTKPIDAPSIGNTGMENPVNNQNTQPVVQQTSGYTPRAFTLQDFNTHKNLRNPYHGHRTVAIDGKVYPVRVTTGLYGSSGIDNDQMYAFDEATGMIRKIDENMIGFPSGRGFAKDSQWIHPSFFYEEQWLEHNPVPNKRGPLGGNLTTEYTDWYRNKYMPAAQAGFRKHGGTMNKIKYFQQGGAVPQQDIQAQVTALVQAAMQGDQKATQTVNKILEAAKNGDQQAAQLAQMIQQVAKQMQGQAVSAKYGSKLSYLQSLKCGGKTKKTKKAAVGTKMCPECDSKLVSKAQNGAVAGASFYRNWSPEDIKKLQKFLASDDADLGDASYKGAIDGKIGAKTIAAVKAYQKKHNLKTDGMWGANTNSMQKVLGWDTMQKARYKDSWKGEAGDLRNKSNFTYANADSMSQKQLDELVTYYTMNPELLYSDDAEHARNRQIFHNSGKWGADFLNQTLASLTPEERSRINAKKTTTQYKQDEMISNVNKERNEAAGKIIPVLAAPLALHAGLPAIATGAIGSAIGGYAGENYGYLAGVSKANETDENGYVNNYSDPVANRYGVPTVINDQQRVIDESTRAGRGMGAAIGGMLGGYASRFLGRPSLDGLRAEHSQSPQLAGRKSTLATYQYRPRQNYGPRKPKVQQVPPVVPQPVVPGVTQEPFIDFENLSRVKRNGGLLIRK